MQNPEEDDGGLVLEHLKKRLCYLSRPKLSFPSIYLAQNFISPISLYKFVCFTPFSSFPPILPREKEECDREEEGKEGRG
jgi:hypothetical protein